MLFHVLGSQGSSVMLEAGGLILRDNDIPAWQAPWYGREISVLAQTLIPLVFFVPTGLHLRRNGSNARQARIGDGILIFAACMVIGSLLHAWWLIYLGAVPCLALWIQAIHGDLLDRLRRLQAPAASEQEPQQADAPAPDNVPDDERVATAGAWIEQHLADDLRVDDIAAAVGMSPSHLQHLFRQHRDCTINQFLVRQRIASAQELLRATTDTVTAIAFSVGFNDSNYFSTVFRKQVGMSPSAWRKQER